MSSGKFGVSLFVSFRRGAAFGSMTLNAKVGSPKFQISFVPRPDD
jgi:hypothetical protein